ncbi:MAG TPA: hypothetical protein VE860_15070 [Chthoniobacterales bacterium]|nr:hypothetical protein [Chthoniobacterales bacterium]
MPDVYVQYEGSRPLSTPNCVRIYVRGPSSKIEAYRWLHNDRVSSDNEIARKLSEVPSTFGFRQSYWEGDVKYLDDLPAGLHKYEPTFEENGIGFWAIESLPAKITPNSQKRRPVAAHRRQLKGTS